MKKIGVFLIIFLLLMPMSIKAGVMCNDGWESSCEVSGPGCCSHHGGVAGGGSYNGNSYGNSDAVREYQESEDFGDKLVVGFWIIVIGGFVILGAIVSAQEKKEKKKTNEIIELYKDEPPLCENSELDLYVKKVIHHKIKLDTLIYSNIGNFQSLNSQLLCKILESYRDEEEKYQKIIDSTFNFRSSYYHEYKKSDLHFYDKEFKYISGDVNHLFINTILLLKTNNENFDIIKYIFEKRYIEYNRNGLIYSRLVCELLPNIEDYVVLNTLIENTHVTIEVTSFGDCLKKIYSNNYYKNLELLINSNKVKFDFYHFNIDIIDVDMIYKLLKYFKLDEIINSASDVIKLLQKDNLRVFKKIVNNPVVSKKYSFEIINYVSQMVSTNNVNYIEVLSNSKKIMKCVDELISCAVRNKNDYLFEYLLTNNIIDINYMVQGKIPVISFAIIFSNYNFVKNIINKNKLDINIKDTDGYTPLDYACNINKINMIKLVRKNGGITKNNDDLENIDFSIKNNINIYPIIYVPLFYELKKKYK